MRFPALGLPQFPWAHGPRWAWFGFSAGPSCHGKAEECIGLCRALMSALNWLLRCAAFYADKLKETLEQAAAESQLKMCLERLEKMLSSTKNRALIHIAKLEETCMSLPCPVAHSARSCCQGSLPPPHRWPWGDVIATSPFPLPGSCRIVPAAQAHPSSSPVAVTISSLAPCHPLPPPIPPCCPWKRSRINAKAVGAVPGRVVGPVLLQQAWHSPAPSASACGWSRGRARPEAGAAGQHTDPQVCRNALTSAHCGALAGSPEPWQSPCAAVGLGASMPGFSARH